MSPADIVSLLGTPSNDPALDPLWRAFDLRWRPALDPEERETFTDWLPLRDVGIEFGFMDEAYLRALDPWTRGEGPMRLHEVIFYGSHPTMQRYRGDLPFGIDFGMRRPEVRRLIDPAGVERRSYVRDVWEFEPFRLIVSYGADGDTVADVVCALREEDWPPANPLPPHPDPFTLARLLGTSVRAPAFLSAFRPLGVGYELDRLGDDGVINKRDEFGFDIHVGAEPGAIVPTGSFDSITLYRSRDLDARQWAGDLPFGLRFDDAPAVLFRKVTPPCASRHEQLMSGNAIWHLEGCSLQVQYSTFDNTLHRITLYRRGLIV